MDKPGCFQSALSGFTTEAAYGGAVRHLVDIGYTLDQIIDRLNYPAPRMKVQRIMMAYLYESHVLLREEPSEELFAPKSQLVQEQNAYGRRSFRKVSLDSVSQNKLTSASTQGFLWKESVYEPKRDGKLAEMLYRKCEKNGEIYSYVSCTFGKYVNDQSGQKLSCLNGRQREYLQGICWDQPLLYHRLDQRMIEMVSKLYEAGAYEGACFFSAEWEKMFIPAG